MLSASRKLSAGMSYSSAVELANDVCQALLLARVMSYPEGWGLMPVSQKFGLLSSVLARLEQEEIAGHQLRFTASGARRHFHPCCGSVGRPRKEAL